MCINMYIYCIQPLLPTPPSAAASTLVHSCFTEKYRMGSNRGKTLLTLFALNSRFIMTSFIVK